MKECEELNNEYVQRLSECRECGKVHWHMTGAIGLKVDAYTPQWKAKKDDMRHRHQKDMLQPLKDGKPNEEFIKTYGKLPFKNKAKNANNTR
mgnify:CR=1 FL=1